MLQEIKVKVQMEFKIGRPLLLAGKLREDVWKNSFNWTGFLMIIFKNLII